MKGLKQFCLAVIYAGIGVSLAAPLLLDSGFFYPFITTKAFVFRTAVQAMLAAFLVLQAVSADYRPKLPRSFWPLLGFVLWAALVSLLAGNFYNSFWSNMERSEGLLLWLHLLAFALIVVSVLGKAKHWHVFLDISVGVAWLLGLFGLGQFFKLQFLLSTSGARVDATIGNPAFLAAYMLFQIAFALYLFFARKPWLAKIYYLVSTALFAWTVLATQTRGAVIGLIAGIMVAGLLLAFYRNDNQRVKQLALLAVVAVAVISIGLYLARQTPLVKNSPVISRLTSISLAERTVETRLVTWRAAWEGWKEKFITGVGLENFNEVFDKRFPPIIYQKEGSQIWFDRAHNLILDRGATTGIVGLLLYLAFLFYPAFWLLRSQTAGLQARAAAIIFLGFITAFVIQDLFVFESVTTYILIAFTWAWFAWYEETVSGRRAFSPRLPAYAWSGLAIAAAVWFVPLLWYTTWYPAAMNRAAAAAMRFDSATDDFFRVVNNFKVPLEAPTYGRPEYRVQFIEFIDGQLANSGKVADRVLPVLEYADAQIEQQLKDAPRDAKNYLLAMRHYNYTFAADPNQRLQRLQRALSYFDKAVKLSPTRPQMYQEAGYSHLYLYRDYKTAKEDKLAAAELASAESLFYQALDLNPKVVESYINLIMLYLNAGDDAAVQKMIELMDQRGVNFRTVAYLSKLRSLAVSNGRVEWIGRFAQMQVELNPADVESWINLAVYYATIGNRAKAIELADKIRAFGEPYISQAEMFVANVKAGAYEKK